MNLKELLPYENYTLATRLSVEEVRKRIADNIQPKRNYRVLMLDSKHTKPYEGELTGSTFTINRIINYRNSFLPTITGNIAVFFGETRVSITMRPFILVLIFIIFFLSFTGRICIYFLITWFSKDGQMSRTGISPQDLIPFGMFLFGYLMTILAFKSESQKSKKFLADLLEGEKTNA